MISDKDVMLLKKLFKDAHTERPTQQVNFSTGSFHNDSVKNILLVKTILERRWFLT